MKRVLFFLFFLAAVIYWQTDGFLPSKVVSDLSMHPQWATPTQRIKEVHSILEQKFTYLDKGHQSFVFVSQDQKYVIKLINHQRFSVTPWLHLFPLPDWLDTLRQKYLARRNRKFRESFDSFALAANELPEKTGTIFVQLNRNNNFKKPLVVYDRLSRRYEIDLNAVEFVLQKRVKMLYPALQDLMQQQGERAFEKGVVSFLDAIAQRALKEISDDDLDVEINMGMIGTHAYIIDTGRFFKERALKDPGFFKEEMQKSVRFFEAWLKTTYPEKMPFFKKALAERLVASFHILAE